ncbi:MAG: hypothetical protein Q7V20_22970 [Aquabacterium sp.]|uniref:hypothetical protein n=1 Tax=Aquabacterium sp. TaxID=1872578 RepID=UPI00271D1525|nr:hypothetical protein [Aquabacterium sp.]MDO9006316.1 hypothetical protein [Aquabacterium sp.]
MTPAQIALARHALGLPNSDNRSYRNRFCAGKGHSDHPKWNALVSAGLATVTRHAGGLGGQDTFRLTLAGAKAALAKGESLCPEDFPEVQHG